MIVASFWVLRPDEHPEAEARNYPGMLRVLQASCDRIGLQHVVLTDRATYESPIWPETCAGYVGKAVPRPLMRAVTDLQAQYLEERAERKNGTDVLFVGADCIFIKAPAYPLDIDIAVTYRTPDARYPINTGLIIARARNLDATARVFRRIAERCGEKWCDDQRAIRAELEPMPYRCGLQTRGGLQVAFLPMRPYNVTPRGANDPALGAFMIHFRGKARKQLFFEWAANHGY